MSKFIARNGSDYSPSEDINDVRQLVALVKARPAAKREGERATLIAYSELAMIEKRLKHALDAIADMNDSAREAAKVMHEAAKVLESAEVRAARAFVGGNDFVRPRGATPKPAGFTVELRDDGMFEIQEGAVAAHRAWC